MPWWSTLSWDVARAGGFAAYGLLTLSMILGLALSLRLQSAERWPRLINNEMHQYLLLLSGVFTVVHGFAAWLDPFMAFKPAEVLIPGISHYRPLWMALGIVAAYLGIAVGITTWLRPHIGYAWWRRFHYFTFLVWALATVHGLGTGSDSQTLWAQAIYAGSTVAVMGLLAVRFVVPVTRDGKRHPGWVLVVAAITLGGTAWAAKGPTQSGWNAIANNGNGSGARIALGPGGTGSGAASGSTRTVSYQWPSSFTATYRGSITTQGPDDQGHIALIFSGPLSSVGGQLTVTLVGTPYREGVALSNGTVAAGPSVAQNPIYQGNLTDLTNQQMEAQVTDADGHTWNLVILLNISPDNQSFTGHVEATAIGGATNSGGASGGGNATGIGL